MKGGIPIRASLAVLVLGTTLPLVALVAYNAYWQPQPGAERLVLNAAVSLTVLVLAAALAYLIARRIEMLASDFRAMLKARTDAELELREGAAGLRRAQLMAQLAHVITGKDGLFESWSETLAPLIGGPVPKGTREWLALLHPEDREAFRATSIDAAVKRSGGFVEYRLRRPDGEWIHVRQVMEPMPARESDGVIRWFSTLQNVTAQKRAAEAMRQSQGLKSAILESSLDCLVTMDQDGNAVEFNPAAEATFGFHREEVLGKSIADLIIPPRFRDAHRRGLARCLESGEGGVLGRRLELYALRRDGTEFPVELAITPIKSGPTPMFTASIRDITERRRSEAGLKRLNRVYAVLSGINSLIVRVRDRQELFRESCRLAVDAGGFACSWIGVVDRQSMRLKPVAWQGQGQEYLDLMPLELNPAGPMFGLAGQAIVERRAIIVEDMATDSRILLRDEARKRGFHSLVMLPLVVAGEPVALLALYAAEIGFFDEGEMKLLLELAADIAFALEHIAKADRLDYLAYHDSLTGLANRAVLMDRLAQAVSTAGREQRKFALVLVDIERFKIINDTLGRQAGDALLRQMAERLTELTGDSNRLARISADHFAVMIPEVADEAKVARIIEKGGARVQSAPFVIGGTELRVAVRSGIAIFPNDGAEADVLFNNAEAALKNAKARGEKYLFYTQQMTERVAGKLSLENKLRLALDNEEFVLHYQPKVDLQSRRIVGLEALIRWQSPELGLVPPMKFIPLLEETGLILPVGSWALRRASLDHRRWVERKLKPPKVAVNVSTIQLRQRDFIGVLEQAIMEGVVPAGIDLEITESLIMEDIQGTIEKLREVRKLGVGIAIDDFGTGYSSLSYLARLPVSSLKIDRSFIIAMLENADATTLIQTIISMAHSLRLKVVAEGVETEEQATMLKLLHCDQMQGYLFSKPLPLEDVTALLTRAAGSG